MPQAGDDGKQQAHVYGEAAAAGISEAGSQAQTMAGQAGAAGQDLAKQAKHEGAQIAPAADRIASEVIEPGAQQVHPVLLPSSFRHPVRVAVRWKWHSVDNLQMKKSSSSQPRSVSCAGQELVKSKWHPQHYHATATHCLGSLHDCRSTSCVGH